MKRAAAVGLGVLAGALGAGSVTGSSAIDAPPSGPSSASAAASGAGAPVTQQVRTDFEGLFSRDVQLTQWNLGYVHQRPGVELSAGAYYNTYDLDYRPAPDIDFLGASTHVSERRIGALAGAKAALAEPLQALVSGGFYDGYGDYRSAWLNEYYRQQFSSVRGFGDDYVKPNPHGESVNLGLRWEYLPGTGFVQGDFTYAHDEIAPGYEIDFNGLRRGRPNLYTGVYHASFENVVTRRIRLLNEFRLSDTTNRKLRYGYQGSLNVAVAEDWVVRAIGGYAREQPLFEARYAGAVVEHQPAPGWWVSASARYYRDSGEIENSLFSSAAPGLEGWQTGVGVRHAWGGQSVKAFAGPYFTRYDPIGLNTAFFENLYRTRTWVSVQLAYNAEF